MGSCGGSAREGPGTAELSADIKHYYLSK